MSGEVSKRDRTFCCDQGEQHREPFYTVSVLAVLVGPGTRGKSQKRRMGRKVIGHFCSKCVGLMECRFGETEFRALGHALLNFEESHKVED
jgi:hypothetical protein